ncbi:hypothetical protein M9434_007212 [Picochlorum sp. BPE23]|nr:hypothetical protein M9434_007212 [Picochlorum sp. BPE23]
MPETEANDMGEDAVDGSVSDTPLEQSWEQDFRDIENPIQKRGARQTGAQVRENLDKNIGTKGMTLAKVLYNILEKDRPVHVIEDILSVSRMMSIFARHVSNLHGNHNPRHLGQTVLLNALAKNAHVPSVWKTVHRTVRDSKKECLKALNPECVAITLVWSIKSTPCTP